MIPARPTEVLHLLLRDFLQAGDIVVDATAGNGHDTIFLANAVGSTGRVLAFDIQQQAIEETRNRLIDEKLIDHVTLHQESHANLAQHLTEGSAAAIIFNLGYLPGADHAIFTETEETLLAINAALPILRSGGMLAVTCYPGHEGGDSEASAVETRLAEDTQLRTAKYQLLHTKRPSPFLLIASLKLPKK